MCCTWLAGNAGPKKLPKTCHLGTIAQLCGAISLQLRHISTIGKKLVNQQYLLHMSPQYGELQPTSSWYLSARLGHPQISTVFASWQRYCTALRYWASAKFCGIEQKAIFSRAAITLGISPHSSFVMNCLLTLPTLFTHIPFTKQLTRGCVLCSLEGSCGPSQFEIS